MSGKYPQFGQVGGTPANAAAVVAAADLLAPGLPWEKSVMAYHEGRYNGVYLLPWQDNPHEYLSPGYHSWFRGFTHGSSSDTGEAFIGSMFNTGVPDQADI